MYAYNDRRRTVLHLTNRVQEQQRIWHVGTVRKHVMQQKRMGMRRKAKAGAHSVHAPECPACKHFVSKLLSMRESSIPMVTQRITQI